MVDLGIRSGTCRDWLLWGEMMDKGSQVNFSEVYCENMATRMLITISTFVASVAVHSMKTFVVLVEIFEWLPLIIGGNEHTVRFAS